MAVLLCSLHNCSTAVPPTRMPWHPYLSGSLVPVPTDGIAVIHKRQAVFVCENVAVPALQNKNHGKGTTKAVST